MSIPDEPNSKEQERAEIMDNLAQVAGDDCETWLRRRGMGTQSFRETISQHITTEHAKKKAGNE